MITTTKTVTLRGSSGEEVTAKINPDTRKIELIDGYDEDTIGTFTWEEFLDWVVACWPENVAYEFKDDDDE